MRISAIDYRGSFVDGPGIRTVIFLQGCDRHCDGCHNPSTWDPAGGTERDIEELAEELREHVRNRKITISGGEPLNQYEAVLGLLDLLDGFDICLYTGFSEKDVLERYNRILPYVKYLKTGGYDKTLRTSTVAFIGSKNQKFFAVKGGKLYELGI